MAAPAAGAGHPATQTPSPLLCPTSPRCPRMRWRRGGDAAGRRSARPPARHPTDAPYSCTARPTPPRSQLLRAAVNVRAGAPASSRRGRGWYGAKTGHTNVAVATCAGAAAEAPPSDAPPPERHMLRAAAPPSQSGKHMLHSVSLLTSATLLCVHAAARHFDIAGPLTATQQLVCQVP
eukprot:366426-Chlamydomonas_euryale.AAC.10